MLRNVATPAAMYAIRQRHEKASRIAARPKNGNRYRSWTRVGTAKNARARTLTPTRIVSLSGRRATSTGTTANSRSPRAMPPTRTAGNGPICAQLAASATGASKIQPPLVAMLTPSTGNSAQAL